MIIVVVVVFWFFIPVVDVVIELELIICWNYWRKPELQMKLGIDVDEVENSFLLETSSASPLIQN